MSACYTACPDGYKLSGDLCVPDDKSKPPISGPNTSLATLRKNPADTLGLCEHCPSMGCVLGPNNAAVVGCAPGLGACIITGDNPFPLRVAVIVLAAVLGLIAIVCLVCAIVKHVRRRRGGYQQAYAGGGGGGVSFASDFFNAIPDLLAAIFSAFSQ